MVLVARGVLRGSLCCYTTSERTGSESVKGFIGIAYSSEQSHMTESTVSRRLLEEEHKAEDSPYRRNWRDDKNTRLKGGASQDALDV